MNHARQQVKSRTARRRPLMEVATENKSSPARQDAGLSWRWPRKTSQVLHGKTPASHGGGHGKQVKSCTARRRPVMEVATENKSSPARQDAGLSWRWPRKASQVLHGKTPASHGGGHGKQVKSCTARRRPLMEVATENKSSPARQDAGLSWRWPRKASQVPHGKTPASHGGGHGKQARGHNQYGRKAPSCYHPSCLHSKLFR